MVRGRILTKHRSQHVQRLQISCMLQTHDDKTTNDCDNGVEYDEVVDDDASQDDGDIDGDGDNDQKSK